MFASKIELLKSLPAISASDFIIYDTSAQDETKPYVLASFSFYNETAEGYTYRIETANKLGNFITRVFRSAGSSGYSGIYMADVRTYYYDITTSQWILDQIDTKGQRATSSIGLKGSIDTIIYSTRDVYVNSSTIRSKDNRFLLSGRFRNETPFDEFFNEEHLSELNYEEGDHLLRLKYADNYHALFVIKQATSPLSITYSSSSTSTYSLTTSGTISGLECEDNIYTTVSSISQIKNNQLSFDDYVLYSTLDITYEGRTMRLKDHHITGTRDEIVAINGLDRVQIDIPHKGYEVITNPSDLEVECLTELPETFTQVDSFVAQFRAGTSYAYEHYFETIDELEKWDKFNLPPKQVIADFYDGNDYRIIYQSAEKDCQMLTFSMEEGCNLYWGNSSSAYWYFTDKTKASNFKLYSLSKEGIGEATTVDWRGSSYNYLNITVTAYNRDVECIFFNNTPLYDSDKTTVLVEKMSFDWLSDTYFHLKTIQFNPDARIKVGETWEQHVEVVANQSDKITYKSLTFEGDYQPTYDKHGSYVITANLVVDQYPDQIHTASFLLNIHEDETTFNYPNVIPFPPRDGMKTFVAFQGETDIELFSFTATEGVYGYFSSTAYLNWTYKHADGGYDSTTGTYFYKLDENNQWVLQANKQTSPSPNPSAWSYVSTDYNDVFFTNVDIYDSSSKTNVLIKGQYYPREEYSIKKRPFEPPFELPSVKEVLAEDQAQHYFMMYCKADIYLVTIIPEVLEDFHIYQLGGYSVYLYPSCRMTSVKYRKLDKTNLVWNSPSSYTNQTSFNSSWVFPSYSSTLNDAKTLNDMIIYTTMPVYLKRSTGTAPMVLARTADNQLVADENSIAPIVTDISFGTEEPYTVDSKFVFNTEYMLEDLDGLMFGGIEWKNTMPYYPSGEHTVSARVKDSRGLCSEWLDKTFTVEPVIIPDYISIDDLPTKSNGEPYDHYLVAKTSSTASPYNYDCFAFDLKEGVEEFKTYLLNDSWQPRFNDTVGTLFDNATIFEGYYEGYGWERNVYPALNKTYLERDGVTFKIISKKATDVVLSTFPLYEDSNYETIRIHPIHEPQFPLTITCAATHENVWTSDDVKVSYNIALNGQVLKEAFYRVNGGESTSLSELSGEITFSQTGEYHVEFVATNNGGNESKSEVFFKIDKIHPVLSIEEDEAQLIFTAIDEDSGIDKIYYRLAETDVFTRSQNFARHLAIVLNETSEDENLSKNSWIEINSGYKLKKPVFGGIYTYELMATDKVGNTHMVQYVYDLPKIPLQEIVVSPNPVDLTYKSTATLKVSYLPENHNEEIKLLFESLNPDYVSVDQKGNVQNIDAYYEGETIVRVSSNNTSTDVIVNSVINRVEYPSNYPSLYDIHHYTDQFSDFLIAKDRYYGNFYLYAFNREENDAIFYLTTRTSLFNHLGYSIANTVSEAKYFAKLSKDQWNREGSTIQLAENMLNDWYLSSKNPHESVVFSTVDLYTDATGERLIRPKDELPETNFARVWFEPDYIGGWVGSSAFTIHGEETGSGLAKLTYSINGKDEIVVENGGTVVFPHSGTHTLQGFAYNEHNVRSETEILTVQLDFEAPNLSVEKIYNPDTLCWDVYATLGDELSTLDSLRYQKSGEMETTLYFKGDTEAKVCIDSHPIVDFGTFYYDLSAYDVAGNENYQTFVLEVEKPTPTGITVSPASIDIKEGESIVLDIQVDIIGNLEEDEITLSGYDDFVIDVNGFEVFGLTAGFTTITVSCRGVSTTVPVNINPAFIPVETLEVSPTQATLEIGEQLSIQTVITPDNATDKTIRFEVSDESVVRMVSEGIFEAVSKGNATITVSTHNNITQSVQVEVLKQPEKPVIQSISIQPVSPYVGQSVQFSYKVILDDERGAKIVEEKWTNKQESYSEAGTHMVSLQILDSNGLWSEPFEFHFAVRPVSNIKVKVGNTYKTLAISNQETPIRLKTEKGWVSLLTTNQPSPVRVKLNNEWVFIQIEE